jgi:hypothetical protein
MDRFERFTILEIIMLTARHGVLFLDQLGKNGFAPSEQERFTDKLFSRSINWDPAFRKVNRWLDRCVGAMKIADPVAREKEFATIVDEVGAVADRVRKVGSLRKEFYGPQGRGDFIGDVLMSLMLPAFHKVQNAALRCEQLQRLMEIAFALAAFRADQKHFPAKLEELVPKYISKVPTDLFSKQQLIYRLTADGYFLNSVGPNGQDEDGRSYADDPPGDDVAVRMPVPAPHPRKP